jgi:hypothetical protein
MDGQANAHRLVHTLLPLTLIAVGAWVVCKNTQQRTVKTRQHTKATQ